MLRRYLLLYDELWVPGLKNSYPDEKQIEEWDLDREHLASIGYLSGEGFIIEPPVDLSAPGFRGDGVTRALIDLLSNAESALDKAYPTAERAARETAAAYFNMDIAVSRLISYILWRDREEFAYPVVFPLQMVKGLPEDFAQTHQVLSIVLKRLPTPVEDLPLEDLVAFKRDPDTQYRFARFWHWTNKIGKGIFNQHDLEEEIDWLITDYSHHLEQLTKEVNYERAEVLIATPVEMLEDIAKLRWGKVVRALFALGKRKISAHSAELKLPGSELAYITDASEVLSRRYRRTQH
jgi:hypothetical protein